MNRYKLNIIMIFMLPTWLLGVLCPGCSSGEYSRELLAIDSLLQTDPDSAWQRLCEYDTSLLISDNDRHYYALLSAEANDKTYRDDIPEDAISEAAEYFAGKKDKRKAMRSMFYKGISYQNSGKYGPAIITQLKGIEMSDTSDHLYRGKIYNAISEIYKEVSDAPQELDYARRSLEEYRKLDSLVFIEDMKLVCGYAMCQNNKIDEGVAEMKEVYSAAMKRNDEDRTEAALKYMALGCLWGGDNKRAKDCLTVLYNNTDDKVMLGEYLLLYLNSMIYVGSSPDSVQMIKDILINEPNTQENLYNYYAYRGAYKEAYLAAKRALQQNDSIIEELVRSNVSYEIKKYMEVEQSKASSKIKQLNGIMLWVIVSVALLISLFLSLVWVYSVSKRNKEKNLLYSLEVLTQEKAGITNRIAKLSLDNKHLLEENDILKRKYLSESNVERSQPRKPKDFESELISKLFGEMDSLHTQYYLHGNSEKGKNILLTRLSEQLTFLREDKDILRNMERYVNAISDGMLDEVYEQARPNADQRRIVALLSLGFSKEAICQIMGIEMSSFYTRMNRLAKKVEGCNSPRRNELLELIGRKKG